MIRLRVPVRRAWVVALSASAIGIGVTRTALADDCAPCAPCADACEPSHGHGHGHHGHGLHHGYGGHGHSHGWHRSPRLLVYPRYAAGYSWWRRGGPSPYSLSARFATCGYRFHHGPCHALPVLGRGAYPWPSAWRRERFLLAEETPPEDTIGPLVPTRLASAHEAHFRGEFHDAARQFEQATEADPTDAAAWVGLAHASFGAKDWARAAAALRRAAALGALDPEQRLDVESAYGAPETFEDLLSALRARVAHWVFDVEARLVLGYFEAGLGETQNAKDDLLAVLRRSPGDACALCLLGRAPSPAAVLAQGGPAR
jgi:hypothetical protein